MKEKIIELLNSDNIQDKLLGIIICEKESLTNEIFPKDYHDTYSHCLYLEKGFAPIPYSGYLIILNNKRFYISYNKFIGIVKGNVELTSHTINILYTDNSIDIL